MQKYIFLTCLFFTLAEYIFAQTDSSKVGYVSVSLCTPYYIGDIHDYKQTPKAGISVAYSFPLKPNSPISFIMSLSYTKIAAADWNSSKKDRFHWRGLHFRSPLTEFGIRTAYDFRKKKRLKPNISLGTGLLIFNPQANLGGIWYDLQAYGTEGQNLVRPTYQKPYKLATPFISLGVGAKYQIRPRWEISFETRFQLTFTDYLDDISTVYPESALLLDENPIAYQLSDRSDPTGWAVSDFQPRGNPKTKDGYFLSSVGVCYRLGKK